ncbi:hypothetical protein PRIPAC_97614 [Pristionchus pacificus]|uniref:Membrane transporter n=1 Tax=Pristionchus pacificus TaxID=54126 RepID=A0A2A6CUT5_PRIPA|nr:hypothetical protein PRIPAC_97614 [Pristionchus pacificus]|eukprot:PDM81781.1 membrane transporter [Pristionchus pacificus]
MIINTRIMACISTACIKVGFAKAWRTILVAVAWIVVAWNAFLTLQVHTEPIILIMSGANSAVGTVNPTLKQDKMNRTYGPAPPDEDEKKYLNKYMVLLRAAQKFNGLSFRNALTPVYWDQQYDYINTPVSIVMGVVYGSYSDKHGRKLPMLIGLVSVMLSTSLKMLMYSEVTDWPLEWTYPMASFCGLFGDWSLTMTCVNSYLTDIFPDKKQLSFRMVVISIIFSLGNFGGAQFTDLLLNVVDMITILGISLGLTALSFLYGVFILRPTNPTHIVLKEEEAGVVESDEEQLIEPPKETILETTKNAFLSLWFALRIFIVKRRDYRRLFLYMCFIANFLDQFVFGEEKSLLGTYTKLAPFNWGTHEWAQYKSLRPIVQIIGMTIGLALLKKVFKFRDTLCICLAIASMASCVLLIGLAQSSWMIYVSMIPEAFHGLLNPLTFTFMSCIVRPDEIGKAYAVSSIAQELAKLAQTAILQNIYTATVDWYQGFVWLLMAGVSGVAVGIYAFIHVLAKRRNVGS